MQKKLLAVAVAGALFSPLAMAQSAVTISGVFKVGIDNYRISNPGAARGDNTNETRLTDNSSRIIFGITEDLGGGLAGIAQLDVRPQLDDAGEGNVAAGNTWVGIRSNTLGTLTFGRHDLHYGKQPDDTAALAGALMASAVSLMDHIGPTAIANATRTPNVIRWDSPNWSGFGLTVAYSTNAAGNEADIANGNDERKGNAWNFNPSYTSGPFQVGFSHWRSKADAPGVPGAFAVSATTGAIAAGAITAAAGADQNSNVFYGYYRLGAFKIGLAINDSEFENPLTGDTTADRRAWTVPVSWTMGPHHLAGHYSKAGDNNDVEDTGASMIAIAYSYLLSKRTSVGLTFAKISNDDAASYNFFTNTGALGSTNSAMTAGEDGRLVAFTIRHAF